MATGASSGITKFTEDFLSFNADSIEEDAESLIRSGMEVKDLLTAAQGCIGEVGRKFEQGEYFLPELIISGEIFKKVSEVIKRNAGSAGETNKRVGIVLGTPQGDIHNLGKDIFAVLADAHGFAVHDLGVDVAPAGFVEKLEETGASILGLSALLTTTYKPITEIVSLLESKGLREKTFVIIGGAATTKDMVQKLGVNAQTWDAYEGIRILKSVIKSKEATV